MTFRTLATGVCLAVLAALSPAQTSAQTKISGTSQCAKPETQQKVDVPDHPDHVLAISQAKCTWTKAMEVAGIQNKDGVSTGAADIHSGAATVHGYYVDNMANGDKAYVHYQGTDSAKDGTSMGKWTYTGGTGKLKGIKGQGTYKGKAAADGSVTYEIEGEYSSPKYIVCNKVDNPC